MNFNTNDYKLPKEEKLTVTCSGIVRHGDEKCIYVRFEKGDKYAEGKIPGGEMISHKGFSDKELQDFKEYMREYETDIVEQAKQVNLIKNFMK